MDEEKPNIQGEMEVIQQESNITEEQSQLPMPNIP
jgi:hypothetical protein